MRVWRCGSRRRRVADGLNACLGGLERDGSQHAINSGIRSPSASMFLEARVTWRRLLTLHVLNRGFVLLYCPGFGH